MPMFKVYTGPKGAGRLSPLEKANALRKEFGSLDEAFSWASHANGTGRSVLLIEGDDGRASRSLKLPPLCVIVRASTAQAPAFINGRITVRPVNL
jgi:hypothetical protein